MGAFCLLYLPQVCKLHAAFSVLGFLTEKPPAHSCLPSLLSAAHAAAVSLKPCSG
jgi:hypothetical protein